MVTVDENYLIPAGYFCNWTFSTDPNYKYSLAVKRTERLIQMEMIQLKLRGLQKEDILTDEYLWNMGNFISTFRINYPREVRVFARNRFRQYNRTMLVTLQAEQTV